MNETLSLVENIPMDEKTSVDLKELSSSVEIQQTPFRTRFESNEVNGVLTVKSFTEGLNNPNSIDALHTEAKKQFINHIEKILKNSKNKYEISGFNVGIGINNGKMVLIYRVNLKKVSRNPDRVIGIRGKLHQNRQTLNQLYKKDVLPWKVRMKNAYPTVKFIDSKLIDYSGWYFKETCAGAE